MQTKYNLIRYLFCLVFLVVVNDFTKAEEKATVQTAPSENNVANVKTETAQPAQTLNPTQTAAPSENKGTKTTNGPQVINLGKDQENIIDSQEAYYNYQRRTKALSNAIIHLYAASVFLNDASEHDKAEILFTQAKDLARYAQREYKVEIPLELRQNLGLLSEEEYRIQKEREGLQTEMRQLRSRMESIEERLNQLNSR